MWCLTPVNRVPHVLPQLFHYFMLRIGFRLRISMMIYNSGAVVVFPTMTLTADLFKTMSLSWPENSHDMCGHINNPEILNICTTS